MMLSAERRRLVASNKIPLICDKLIEFTDMCRNFMKNKNFEPKRLFIDDVPLKELFTTYNYLKAQESEVLLYVPGEVNMDSYVLAYKITELHIVFIQSKKEHIPLKITKFNYN